ncbi:hypothetical protein CUMW_239460 [Citrus unshiu]|uniref:Terpene synthase N-terminal domain-containing protein n=1 Tax=Citrus unshiu TaxID=55188 RepID=A0A2H5QLV1_CITUN|nr:hypothetical protein CUMW_239460 [Citrus unshiu]
MALQDSEVPASILNATGGNRPTASYHPTLWGEKFLDCSSADDSVAMDPTIDQDEFEGLKQKIKNMLNSPTDKSFQKLSLIDAVQRLGVAYHFEREIEDELEKLSHDEYDGNDVHTVALRFRLLRQQGYRISCGWHISHHGKIILDDALALTYFFTGINGYSSQSAEAYKAGGIYYINLYSKMIQRIKQLLLKVCKTRFLYASRNSPQGVKPLRRGLTRLEARYYNDVYSKDDSKDQTILRFAKLDFCTPKVFHRKELTTLTEWWKTLDVKTKLPYVGDRIVECYFWIMRVYFEPPYSFGRMTLSKIIPIISIIDNTYDAYSAIEEAQLFTNAIKRGDSNITQRNIKRVERYNHINEGLLKPTEWQCLSFSAFSILHE